MLFYRTLELSGVRHSHDTTAAKTSDAILAMSLSFDVEPEFETREARWYGLLTG